MTDHADEGILKRIAAVPRLELCLWTVVVLGGIIRVVYAIGNNPLDFTLTSDVLRHITNARDAIKQDIVYIMDSVGYQVWLGGALTIIGDSRFLMNVYTCALSLVTPWLYYLWMRESLGKRAALVGYAIMTWLPAWICYSTYFMQETLLLPLVALGLWLVWKSAKEPRLPFMVVAGVICGAAIATKATVIPLMLVAFIGMTVIVAKGATNSNKLLLCVVPLLALIAVSLWSPLKVYRQLHCFLLVPHQTFGKPYFESGARKAVITYRYNFFYSTPEGGESSDEQTAQLVSESPAIYDMPFHPFSNWIPSRQGQAEINVDLRNGTAQISPDFNPSIAERLRYTLYNIIYFFWGDTWPVDDAFPQGFMNSLAGWSRWIWFPMTVFLLIAGAYCRGVGPVTALSLVFLCFCLFQQYTLMEGRYRLPWEGVAIAAMLESFARCRTHRRSGTVDLKRPEGPTS